MTKKEALRVLELPLPAGWERVKKRQRELVKAYHPDRYQTEGEIETAHHRMAEINRAVHHLKRLYECGLLSAQDAPARTVHRSPKKTTPGKQNPLQREERPPASTTKPSSKIDETHQQRLGRIRNKAVSREALEQRFIKHRTRVIGKYEQAVRESIFRRFFDRNNKLPSTSNPQNLYERYVRFRKIQNTLFYAINRPLNVVLKYSGLLYTIVLLLRAFLNHFYKGTLVYQPELFFEKLLICSAGIFLLAMPDYLFRLAVTWRYRDPYHRFYEVLLQKGVFSGKMAASFHAFLVLKYFVCYNVLSRYPGF
jgi:hypothetical protein